MGFFTDLRLLLKLAGKSIKYWIDIYLNHPYICIYANWIDYVQCETCLNITSSGPAFFIWNDRCLVYAV